MCGIAGLISEQASEQDVDLMLSMLAHRGPDEFGTFSQPGLAMGTARLSILDLAHGQQPMQDEESGVIIVMNGEVFNYRELRETLLSQGHRFRSHCDTEVVLRLYLQRGREFAASLNGQFAIAIWDPRSGEVILARDRFGIAPLFYHAAEGVFAFASEIKALFTHPSIPKQINPLAVDQIFTFWTAIGRHTAFAGISELPPGVMLVVGPEGRIEQSPYWTWEFPSLQSTSRLSFDEAKAGFEEHLTNSIKLRLHADVEVGSYLSGGIDSSAIVAFAGGRLSRQLKTFSLQFAEDSYDERSFQKLVADRYETRHVAATCSEEQIAEHFQRVVWHTESPLFRTAPSPLHILSAAVQRDRIKVVLTGEGSDELLLGYDIFREAKIRRFCSRQPQSDRRPQLFKKLYRYLPQFSNPRYASLAIQSLKGTIASSSPYFSHEIRWTNNAANKSYFSGDLRGTLSDYNAIDEMSSLVPPGFHEANEIDRAQYLEMSTLLRGYLLSSQGDRMTMSNSVEARFPFLDNNLLQFATSLPEKYKLNGLRDKYILRSSLDSLLPKEITGRPKFAYQAPEIRAFYRKEKRSSDLIAQYLNDASIRDAGLFSQPLIGKLLDKIRLSELSRMGTRDNMAFVQILSTQILVEQFLRTDIRQRAAENLVNCRFLTRLRKNPHVPSRNC
jgi:asparagine synthase (glutamine-hydrolysing)